MEARKYVTMQEIAQACGVSLTWVSYVLSGKRRDTCGIRETAQKLGYETRNERKLKLITAKAEKEEAAKALKLEWYEGLLKKAEIRKTGIISAKTIAEDLGMHPRIVAAALNGTKKAAELSPKTIEIIRAYGDLVGYVKLKFTGAYGRTNHTITPHKFLEECGKFNTKEELREHMEMLRSRGYTNLEVAHKVGCHYNTVLKYIGQQPQEYTAESMKVCGMVRAKKTAAKRNRVAEVRKAEIRRKIDSIAQAEDRALAMREELRTLEQKIEDQKRELGVA